MARGTVDVSALKIAAITTLVFSGVLHADYTVPAFSGADGAGAYATAGGRGGIVYHVTMLDNKVGDVRTDGAATGGIYTKGTFQYGINDANFKDANGNIIPRTIVFDRGGTIWLGRNSTTSSAADYEGNDTSNSISIGSSVTVAGQTAPGGITIAGGQLKINGKTVGSEKVADVIFRNVAIAPGYGTKGAYGSSGTIGPAGTSTSGFSDITSSNLTYMGQPITRVYDKTVYDAININSRSVMVDHVSAVFSTDESISCNEFCADATVQYTTMAQGQGYPQSDAESGTNKYGAKAISYATHGFSQLWGAEGDGKTSLLHNLYANNNGRNPAVQTELTALGGKGSPQADFRGNVIYNWYTNAGYGSKGEPSNTNFVNNYYKVGVGGDAAGTTQQDTGTAINYFATLTTNNAAGTRIFTAGNTLTTDVKVFQSGNVRSNLGNTTTNLGAADFANATIQSSANSVPYYGFTDSAADAYIQVMQSVGANWQNRSAIDQRIISGVINGTGQIKAYDNVQFGYNAAGVYTAYASEDMNNDTEWNSILRRRATTHGGVGGTGIYSRAANYDSDGDGMPDGWELAHGLNPAVAENNGDYDNNGYTNIEEYINEVGAFPASTPIVFRNTNGNGRYAQIGNWGTAVSNTSVFQPSRFDQVQINAGTTIIDAVGQHAGTIQLGTSGADRGTLQVSGGWLDVAQTLKVGGAGIGTVQHSGGIVRVGNSLNIAAGSSYELSGTGILSVPSITRAGSGSFNFTGGTLHTQLLQFDLVNNGGTLSPGSDGILQLMEAASLPDLYGAENVDSLIGNTHVQGNLALNNGAVAIDLASINTFDTLSVDATLLLGGTLQVSLLNSYTPVPGDYWQIASSNLLVGNFAAVTPGFVAESGLLVTGRISDANALFLVAVPEPTHLLLLTGLTWIGLRRSRITRAETQGCT